MTYDIHDAVAFSVTVKDDSGTAVDPDTIILTVTAPDGSVTTPDPDNVSVGVYRHVFIADQPGQWRAEWSTSGPSAAYSEVANVRSTSEPALISLDDARRHLNLLSRDSDEEVRETIIVASGVIEDLIGPVLPREVVEHHDGGVTSIVLDHKVSSVTSVTAFPGGVIPASDGSNKGYRVKDDQYLTLVSGEYPIRWNTRSVTVVYQAGIGPDVPPRVRQATREMVRHLWDTQRGPRAPRTMEPESFYPGQSFTVPRRVIELLGALVVPGVG